MKQESKAYKPFNCPVSGLERKAFNLEQALAGRPVVTRDGRSVMQLVKFDCVDDAGKVYGVVDCKVYVFTSNGEYLHDSGSCLDLFMTPEKKWVNLYWNEEQGRLVPGYTYLSKEDADKGYFENGEGRQFIQQISFEV